MKLLTILTMYISESSIQVFKFGLLDVVYG